MYIFYSLKILFPQDSLCNLINKIIFNIDMFLFNFQSNNTNNEVKSNETKRDKRRNAILKLNGSGKILPYI